MGGLLNTFIRAVARPGLFIFQASTLGPKKPIPVKDEPFECGEKPFNLPEGRLPVRFYLVAMLFVLFDVELVFFFPWAVVYRQLGLFGFVEMLVFLSFLVLGFFYAWKKGILEFR
jgi:NADH-quinone oxidoreductase subunit A